MTGTAGDLTKDTYSPNGFSPLVGDYSYVIRWNISKSGGVTPTKDLPSIDDQTAVFPNPATDWVHIQFDLKAPAKVMTVEWIDGTKISDAAALIVGGRVAPAGRILGPLGGSNG